MRIVLLAAAIGIAALLAWYVNDQMAAGNQQIQQLVPQEVRIESDSINVIVANRTLGVGTLIRNGDLEVRPWPKSSVREDFLIVEQHPLDGLNGSVVRSELAAGEPVSPVKIMKANDRGFLAAVLKPGTKALSIPVSQKTSASNLIQPGDIVDLILTQTVSREVTTQQANGTPVVQNIPEQVSETILRNARVIATGMNTGRPIAADPAAADGAPPASPAAYEAITLELESDMVQRIALSIELGQITAILSALTKDESDTTSTAPVVSAIGDEGFEYIKITESDVSPARKRDEGAASGAAVTVFRGKGGSSSVQPAPAQSAPAQPASAQ